MEEMLKKQTRNAKSTVKLIKTFTAKHCGTLDQESEFRNFSYLYSIKNITDCKTTQKFPITFRNLMLHKQKNESNKNNCLGFYVE